MSLKTLKSLAWVSVLIWVAVWFATAGPLNPDRNGAPATLVNPDPHDPTFLT